LELRVYKKRRGKREEESRERKKRGRERKRRDQNYIIRVQLIYILARKRE